MFPIVFSRDRHGKSNSLLLSVRKSQGRAPVCHGHNTSHTCLLFSWFHMGFKMTPLRRTTPLSTYAWIELALTKKRQGRGLQENINYYSLTELAHAVPWKKGLFSVKENSFFFFSPSASKRNSKALEGDFGALLLLSSFAAQGRSGSSAIAWQQTIFSFHYTSMLWTRCPVGKPFPPALLPQLGRAEQRRQGERPGCPREANHFPPITARQQGLQEEPVFFHSSSSLTRRGQKILRVGRRSQVSLSAPTAPPHQLSP